MSPIPYGFSPIDPAASVHDAPLWRDGRSDAPRFSGELLITLTTLTPLIVGNHQHALDDKHSLLVSQRLDDGRVLIGAASLKGMLRSALASLLHAPMERVSEHHYTYRPNLAGSGKAKEIRAAVVLSDHHGKTDPLQVALLDPKEVVYLPTNIWKALKCPAPGSQLARGCTGLKFSGPDELDYKAAFRKKIIAAKTPGGEQDRNARITLDHTVLRYVGGIDGEGRLAKAFNENRTIYQYVLYPTRLLEQAKPVTIASAVVAQYHKTQRILADMQIGHLAPGHPLLNKIGDPEAIQKAIEAHTPLCRHQLIYVEYDSNTRQITSLGHHYHYRWAYTSTVTRKGGKKRRELDWLPVETGNPHTGQPERLAAHRLLFGYTLDGGEEGPARGNFRRLAGRIAFNTAIEIPGNKTLEERFVNGGEEIQLRILGMPRPSAVEFYLKQTALPKKLITYGDQVDDLGGDLAGRKFYRHQADAARDDAHYSPSAKERQYGVAANTEERGTLVRYLSRPGGQFRCTLRFDSLRPWELGALLAALDPHRLAVTFGLPPSPEGYAHKLGYGKPLGLGSVRLHLDAARWRENDGWTWQQATGDDQAWRDWSGQALAALKEKLLASWPDDRARSTHLSAWLAARRWAKSGSAAYPTNVGKDGKPTIYGFHTALRRDHAATRRGNASKHLDALKRLLESST